MPRAALIVVVPEAAAIVDPWRELCARHSPFRFRLARTARFPETLYLAPEPAERFPLG